MKKNLLLLVAMFFVVSVFSQGIVFKKGSYNEVLARAKKENKMLFIDVYTEWCEPCKTLSEYVFPDEELGKLYNSKFICFKLDAEKGEGVELAKKFNVKAYPTLLYVGSDGNLIHRVLGSKSIDFLIEEVDKVEAFSKGDNPEAYAKKYTEGERDPKFLLKYYKICEDGSKQEILKEYLMSLSDEELFNSENKMLESIKKYDSKLFTRLVDGLVARRSKDEKFNFCVTFPIQFKLSTYLTQSVNDGNREMFDEIMGFKSRATVLNQPIDKDYQVQEGRGIFFASDEFVNLQYAMKNSKNNDELNFQIRDYIEDFMIKFPQDSLFNEFDAMVRRYPKEMMFFVVNQITINTYSSLRLLDCVERYWRKSETTKGLVSECAKWCKYFYEINPLNHEVALKSANILYRLNQPKDAIAILKKAIGYQMEYNAKQVSVIESLTELIQDIENRK